MGRVQARAEIRAQVSPLDQTGAAYRQIRRIVNGKLGFRTCLTALSVH